MCVWKKEAGKKINYPLKFVLAYKRISEHIGVKLATMDPNRDKALEHVTNGGTMLGIHFNTVDLTWSIPQMKAATYLNLIHIHT